MRPPFLFRTVSAYLGCCSAAFFAFSAFFSAFFAARSS